MRSEYARHVINISANDASQLVLCFDYDQSLFEGPPFSVVSDEVYRHCREDYELACIGSIDVIGGLKGKYEAKEHAWLLIKPASL